jgi:integrase
MTTRDGKRRQAEKTFRGTQAQAQRALNGFLTAEASKTPDARTLGDLLDEWLSFKATNGAAAKTIGENRRKIEHDIRSALGSVPLVDLTAKHLDDQYGKWLNREPRPLSSTTVHHLHAIISAALSQAVKWDYVPGNVAAKATPPPVTKRENTAPDPATVAQLIAQARTSNDRVMAAGIALAYITGARRGELCALRWSDVKMTEGVGGSIRFDKSISEVDDVCTVKGTKTGDGKTIPIDALSVSLLQGIRADAEAFAAKCGTKMVEDPYVISQAADGSTWFEPGRFTDRFTLIRKRAHVRKGVRLHDCRHAILSELVAAGVDIRTVAAIAGHKRTSTTLDIYSHALPASGQAAAAVIGGLLPT